MEVESLINPSWVSILSCMTALGNVLYEEHYLQDADRLKPIPVVNALYNYLFNESNAKLNIDEKKLFLVERTEKNCDIISNKSDPQSITNKLNNIIQIFVFSNYENLTKGFIDHTIRTSGSKSSDLLKDALKTNYGIYGDTSKLEQIAIDNIFRDIVEPLINPNDTLMMGQHRRKRSARYLTQLERRSLEASK